MNKIQLKNIIKDIIRENGDMIKFNPKSDDTHTLLMKFKYRQTFEEVAKAAEKNLGSNLCDIDYSDKSILFFDAGTYKKFESVLAQTGIKKAGGYFSRMWR
jgi:hypothetical protein